VAVGSWERVREAVAHLLEPTDHYPARFRVRQFPDAERLKAIGSRTPDRLPPGSLRRHGSPKVPTKARAAIVRLAAQGHSGAAAGGPKKSAPGTNRINDPTQG
jgi:hypothetical protein